jgi:hypothetical protein
MNRWFAGSQSGSGRCAEEESLLPMLGNERRLLVVQPVG